MQSLGGEQLYPPAPDDPASGAPACDAPACGAPLVPPQPANATTHAMQNLAAEPACNIAR